MVAGSFGIQEISFLGFLNILRVLKIYHNKKHFLDLFDGHWKLWDSGSVEYHFEHFGYFELSFFKIEALVHMSPMHSCKIPSPGCGPRV